MSIKKLFGSTDKVKNYLSDTTEKEAFIDAESARNVEAIKTKLNTVQHTSITKVLSKEFMTIILMMAPMRR